MSKAQNRSPVPTAPAAGSKRRLALARARVAGLTLTLAVLGCGRESRQFDNVVLVTIDTLRADHLGSYGYPRPVSPFIDSLAARGVRFERVVSSSSHTGPAHASLFTSQYPARHRVLVNGVKLAENIPTLAGRLAERDFETAAFLSVEFLQSVSNDFGVVNIDLPPKRRYRQARLTIGAVLDWLEDRDPDRPAFVWVHLFDVHQTGRRHRPPPGKLKRMQADARRRRAVLRPHWMRQHGVTAAEIGRLVDRINRYDAQIAFVDSELRRLFRAFESGGGRNLWIIAADHGEGLGDHGYIGHGRHLYEEQLRVPLILYGGERWPPAGGTIERMVRHVDLLPTVLELTGAPLDRDADLEGRSLVDLISNPATPGRREFALSQRRPPDSSRLDKHGWEPGLVLSAQNERYKYILRSDGEDEFYDLTTDRREQDNLADEENPTKDELLNWLVRKYEAMLADPLTADAAEIEGDYLEELKALGYL